MNAGHKLTYPTNEIVCRCAAFPWPHAEYLSRKCFREAVRQDEKEPRRQRSEEEMFRRDDYRGRL